MGVGYPCVGRYLSIYNLLKGIYRKEESMKTVKVVAAIIRNNNKIFATQRGYGEFKDGWEFPGGKVEAGETSECALIREIQEELDTMISVGEKLDCV